MDRWDGPIPVPNKNIAEVLAGTVATFCLVSFAYAVGLSMANAAVYWMDMGQPALLYLVPCCLGMVLLIGWRRRELTDLWEGSRVIRTADVICYGAESSAPTTSTAHTRIPQDETDDSDGEAKWPVTQVQALLSALVHAILHTPLIESLKALLHSLYHLPEYTAQTAIYWMPLMTVRT